jgi:uncharacterized protein (TIGR02217 family)
MIQVDPMRLPLAIEAGATFTLNTQTLISTGFTGKESRYAKRKPWVEALCNVGPDDAEAVIDLFRDKIGPRYAFTMRDHSDYEATDEVLTPDDSGFYQLTKRYGTDRPRLRDIILPDLSTVIINLDGEPAVSGSYTMFEGGVIHPSSSWAANEVTASFEFFIPVRLADDKLTITVPAPGMKLIQQLRCIEVTE